MARVRELVRRDMALLLVSHDVVYPWRRAGADCCGRLATDSDQEVVVMTPTEHAQLLRELADLVNELADELADGGYPGEAESAYDAQARARQAAAEIENRESNYLFEVYVDGDWVAGGSAPTQEQAEREARHYQWQYALDGACVATVQRCVVIARFGGGEVG